MPSFRTVQRRTSRVSDLVRSKRKGRKVLYKSPGNKDRALVSNCSPPHAISLIHLKLSSQNAKASAVATRKTKRPQRADVINFSLSHCEPNHNSNLGNTRPVETMCSTYLD